MAEGKSAWRYIRIGFLMISALVVILFSAIIVGGRSFFKEMGNTGRIEWKKYQEKIKKEM